MAFVRQHTRVETAPSSSGRQCGPPKPLSVIPQRDLQTQKRNLPHLHVFVFCFSFPAKYQSSQCCSSWLERLRGLLGWVRTLFASAMDTLSLCHSTSTGEPGNENIAAWRRCPSEFCCPWIVRLDGKKITRSSKELTVNNWLRPPRLAERCTLGMKMGTSEFQKCIRYSKPSTYVHIAPH